MRDNMINRISGFAVPFMIASIIIAGLIKKVNIYSCFSQGVAEGLKTIINVFGSMLCIMVGISMFRVSGAMDILIKLLSPVAKLLRIPEEIVPFAIMRPVSGGGSLALCTDLFTQYGPDSYMGRLVSVIMGSTETTFYTIAVYFGSVGIKNISHSLKCALIADFVGIMVSVAVVSVFFS